MKDFPDANILLSIDKLCVEGRDERGAWRPILRGVDLVLRKGEVLGLVGESGAGKSMLGLAALGYTRRGCRFADGRILFDGIDLIRVDEATKRKLRGRRIAYVAQSAAAAFNPAHRIIDQYIEAVVHHHCGTARQARTAALELFARLDLPRPFDIGRRFPHQLSGGQLQRAMAAMAMACSPDIIVFDEPTTALDVLTQIEVLAAIKEAIVQSGTAGIFISHDLAVIAQIAHRTMVLRHGVCVEENATRNVIASPEHAYTKSLWAVRSHTWREQPPAVEAEPLLAVQDLAAAYGNTPVLSGISFALHKGRTLAAVGESGSGKSTLARVLSGLLAPRAGRISFQGRSLSARLRDRSMPDRRRIQLIHQSADSALNPRQTISEIVGRPLELYFDEGRTRKQQRVEELLEMVELPVTLMSRLSTELSGGQKQRVCIARALAAQPDLIICDEITSGLDQIVAESILALLERQQSRFGVSYLFITHDFATVEAIADDVIVMSRGRIIEAGTKADVLRTPRHDHTRRLLASVPQMDVDWLTRLLRDRAVPRSASTLDAGALQP